MSRAYDLVHTEVPSPVTTFGVRGVGEVGTIPPAAAVTNAVCDALADYGVEISGPAADPGARLAGAFAGKGRPRGPRATMR